MLATMTPTVRARMLPLNTPIPLGSDGDQDDVDPAPLRHVEVDVRTVGEDDPLIVDGRDDAVEEVHGPGDDHHHPGEGDPAGPARPFGISSCRLVCRSDICASPLGHCPGPTAVRCLTRSDHVGPGRSSPTEVTHKGRRRGRRTVGGHAGAVGEPHHGRSGPAGSSADGTDLHRVVGAAVDRQGAGSASGARPSARWCRWDSTHDTRPGRGRRRRRRQQARL